ncbi:MAG: porin [Acidobacteriota bacterium]|jgi:hypothetical protein
MKRANQLILTWSTAVIVCALWSSPAAAMTVYEEGDRSVQVGAGIQVQYHLVEPEEGEETDEVIFRRLRPDLRARLGERWDGRVQLELGKASGDNEVKVMDAWMRYKRGGLSVTVGSKKPPFSREFLTSSYQQQLVERTFVGDPNYGTPDRAIGIRLDGKTSGKRVAWAAMVASAGIDPDAGKVDFENPANTEGDFNQGWLGAARLDLHPLGEVAYSQGDLERGPFRFSLSLAGFAWSNDDDNNTYTDAAGRTTSSGKMDVDTADGVELSGAVRGGGFSLDVEYQLIRADSIDSGFSGGLFAGGTAELDKLAVEGGFMVMPGRMEVVGGYQSIDADTYQDAWSRSAVGLNWFWNQHRTKLQLTYRRGENLKGVSGNDADEAFLQLQLVF